MKKHYIVTLDVYMEDDDDQSQLENLDLGALDIAQKHGNIHSWDFRDATEASN